MRRISLSSYKPRLIVLSAAACLAGLLISAQPASAASLTSVSWTTTKSMTSATAATYTYKFTAATTSSLSSVTMTVPSRTGATSVDTGTSGTVTITTGTLGSPTWAASSTTTGATGVTYTYGFANLLSALTSISMTVPPGTSGTPAIGATSGITIGPLTLTSPGALGWSGIITGSAQSVRDGTAAHQQFSLDDERGTGAGWHLTVSATTFVSGLNSLPDAGTFVFTGSLTSVTATTAPSTSCNPSCTGPVTTTTYPVAITTAAVSPVPATVFNAAVGSGTGPVIIGGSAAPNPIGWWINVPAAARAGSYTSTITVAAVSGP